LRIATYEFFDQSLDPQDVRDIFNVCMTKIQQKWSTLTNDDIYSVPIIRQFCDVWDSLPSPDAVDQVFLGSLFPFLAKIWGNSGISPRESKPFYLLYDTAMVLSRKMLTQKAQQFRNKLIEDKIIDKEDTSPLSYIACKHYLDRGFDHVLVGMRKPAYVEQLKELF